MAEQLVNEFTVNRPIDEAWAVITDVERIAPCLPGAQLQEIEGDIYRGVVKVKMGPMTPAFKGQATILEQDDSGRRIVLKAEGRDTGGRGNAAAEISARAESLSPTSTRCVVTTDLHMTGKVAQFGRFGVLREISENLMAAFASNLNTMLDDQGFDETPSPAEAEATATATATATSDDGGARDGDATDDSVGGDHTPVSELRPAGASQSGPSPRVRKIDSPETEPVDFAGVAGPAILKRLVPVLGAVLFLLVLLRRRR
jgi:carbon monoxide dehydrogenase subunit G